MTLGRHWSVATVLGVATLLVGCGITADPQARPVQPPPGPYQNLVSASPAPSPTGPVVETLYMVHSGRLVAVVRKVAHTPSPGDLLRDLLSGPTDAEQGDGVTNALPGANVIGGDAVTVVDGIAAVVLAAGVEGAGRNDEILAYGQVVCTLDSRVDLRGVVFQQDGLTVPVPRGDGSLSSGPLTAADYADLLAEN